MRLAARWNSGSGACARRRVSGSRRRSLRFAKAWPFMGATENRAPGAARRFSVSVMRTTKRTTARAPELADPGHRDGPRHVESGCSQGGVLVNLAHLQLKHPPAVHHPATVSFQPAEQPAGLILRVRVAAGMRGRAHPGPEHPGGRLLIKIEHAVAEQPLPMRDAGGVERGPDRRVPVRVLVDHMDLHRCPAVRYAAAVSRNTSLAAG